MNLEELQKRVDDNADMKAKYMQVGNTLYEMFMREHNNIGNMFKEE